MNFKEKKVLQCHLEKFSVKVTAVSSQSPEFVYSPIKTGKVNHETNELIDNVKKSEITDGTVMIEHHNHSLSVRPA